MQIQFYKFLSCLEYIKKWHSQFNQNFFNNIQSSFNKTFLQLLNYLYSGNQTDFSNIIYQYNLKTNQLYNKIPQNAPYHFIFYFLDLLHYENNYIIDKNFNMQSIKNPGLKNMKNDAFMRNLYQNFFKSAQNSIVSQNFFNIFQFKKKIKCTNSVLNCARLCYYDHKKIFAFNIDEYRNYRDRTYPNKKGMNLTLEDCFKCYKGGIQCQCSNCRCF